MPAVEHVPSLHDQVDIALTNWLTCMPTIDRRRLQFLVIDVY